jgi:hypothetical protein
MTQRTSRYAGNLIGLADGYSDSDASAFDERTPLLLVFQMIFIEGH